MESLVLSISGQRPAIGFELALFSRSQKTLKITKIPISIYYHRINAFLPILTLALFFQIESKVQRHRESKALRKIMCKRAAVQSRLL